MTAGYRLGVDLGTTFTAAAIGDGGAPWVLGLGNRALQIPSVIFLVPDGSILVGEAAERRGMAEPDRLAREFKRRLGDTVPLVVGGRPVAADELMGWLLGWVLERATERMGGPPEEVVLTYPANWGPFKVGLLTRVTEIAGVRTWRGIPEPVAAAAQYAASVRVAVGDRVGVYDLGGGTFDVCVLTKTETSFDILGAPEGVERLGGVDFDEAVFDLVWRSLGDRANTLDLDDPAVITGLARLRRDCVDAKEALSGDVDAVVPVNLPGLTTSVRLTRAEFESLIRPALSETISGMGRALRSAGVEASDLKAIVLVGGSSRIPLVGEMLQHEFGIPVALDIHPKHDVALGAVRVGEAGISTGVGSVIGTGSTPRAYDAGATMASAGPAAGTSTVSSPSPFGAAPPGGPSVAEGGNAGPAEGPTSGPGSVASPSYPGSAGSPSDPGTAGWPFPGPPASPSTFSGSAGSPTAFPTSGFPGAVAGEPGPAAYSGPGAAAPPGPSSAAYRDEAPVAPPQGGWVLPPDGNAPQGPQPLSGTADVGAVAPAGSDAAPHSGPRRKLVLISAAAAVVLGIGTGVAVALVHRQQDAGGEGTPPASISAASSPTSETPSETPSETSTTSAPPNDGIPRSTPLPENQLLVPMRVDGSWAIYLADTGRPEPVGKPIESRGNNYLPALSGDRASVIFLRDGVPQIAAADGTHTAALFKKTPDECANGFTRPAWNPVDESVVVFGCTNADDRMGLYVFSLDGTVQRRLDTGSDRVDDIAFSPDGTAVTYWAAPKGEPGGSIYTALIDGSEKPKRLTKFSSNQHDADPTWAPSGDRIAFRRTRDDNSDIFVMNAETGADATRLTTEAAAQQNPVWSPDSSQLSYKSDEKHSDSSAKVNRIWLMDSADGSNRRPLWSGSAADNEQTTPTWGSH